MKFTPNSTHKPNETSWTTENGYYAILANEHRVTVQTRPPDSDWMHIMPFEIYMEDRGITAFVVRGIMDALTLIPNEPALVEAQDAVKMYLDDVCPGIQDLAGHSRRPIRNHESAIWAKILPTGISRWVYRIYRDDIRRHMKDHADRSQSKTKR